MTEQAAMRTAVEAELGPLGVSTARCSAIATRMLRVLGEQGWTLVAELTGGAEVCDRCGHTATEHGMSRCMAITEKSEPCDCPRGFKP